MFEKTKILAPLLDHAVTTKEQSWPTFDGKMLDRTKYVSSSEAGKCARQIWYSKNLPPAEGKFKWGFAERGHGHEAWIVEHLRMLETEYGFNYVGDEQVSFYDGHQSGTPDGVFSKPDMWGLLEFKSIDPRSKTSALPKPEHLDQCIQNMDIVEACLDLQFDGALLAYSNASDFSLIYEFWIPRNSPQVGERMIYLEDRAEMIMNATSADQLEPEGLYTGGCKVCIFGSVCSGSIAAQQKERNRYDQIKRFGSDVFG